MQNINKKFRESLLDYNKDAAQEILESVIAESDDLLQINNLFFDVLTSIGEEWGKGKLSLSQVYMSGILCEELINEKFAPKVDTNAIEQSQIALVTFADYHTLGKKILHSHLTLSGYSVKDFDKIGDVNILADRCIAEGIKILLISVLMIPSALKIKELRQYFVNKNYEIVLIVGGAPFIFNKQLYKEIDADDTGDTPADAMKLIDKWSKLII